MSGDNQGREKYVFFLFCLFSFFAVLTAQVLVRDILPNESNNNNLFKASKDFEMSMFWSCDYFFLFPFVCYFDNNNALST